MMDWMAYYVEPLTKDSAALLYLNKQIELLQQLASSQEQNIRHAKTIIQQTSK
jgi:hypothetical protein